jgi:hypothetical protein
MDKTDIEEEVQNGKRKGGGWKKRFFGIVSLDKTGIKNKALSSYLKLNISIMESNNCDSDLLINVQFRLALISCACTRVGRIKLHRSTVFIKN